MEAIKLAKVVSKEDDDILIADKHKNLLSVKIQTPEKLELGQTYKFFQLVQDLPDHVIVKSGFTPKKQECGLKVKVTQKEIDNFRLKRRNLQSEFGPGASTSSENHVIKTFQECLNDGNCRNLHARVCNVSTSKMGKHNLFKVISVRDIANTDSVIFASNCHLNTFDNMTNKVIRMDEVKVLESTKNKSQTQIKVNWQSKISGCTEDSVLEAFSKIGRGKFVETTELCGYDHLVLYKSCSKCTKKIPDDEEEVCRFCQNNHRVNAPNHDFMVKLFIESQEDEASLIEILAFSRYFNFQDISIAEKVKASFEEMLSSGKWKLEFDENYKNDSDKKEYILRSIEKQ